MFLFTNSKRYHVSVAERRSAFAKSVPWNVIAKNVTSKNMTFTVNCGTYKLCELKSSLKISKKSCIAILSQMNQGLKRVL